MRTKFINKLFPILMALSLVLTILMNVKTAAAAQTTDTTQHVYDKADLLSSSEVSDLEQKCISYGEGAGVSIFILTHDDPGAVDGEVYIENFFDDTLKGTYDNSVILLVDMANRDVVLEGYGTAETYIHSQRGDNIINEISPYLTDGNYVKAFDIYIERSAAYMQDKSDPNYSRNYTKAPETGEYVTSAQESILTNVFFQLGVAIVIGAIAVGIMAYNSGGRMTVGGNNYIDSNNSGLIGRRDDYIRTTVTRIRKPQNNNSSGGFHGGVSAGGASHSTSRGKF